jgi:hypothetical protein
MEIAIKENAGGFSRVIIKKAVLGAQKKDGDEGPYLLLGGFLWSSLFLSFGVWRG